MNLMLKFLLIPLLAAPPAFAARGQRLQRLLKQKREFEQRQRELNCEYSLLTETEMRSRLLDLMGRADKELAPQDYGGPTAEDYAFHIRILANQLVFKTSSSDKLAGEAFVFASEIAPPKAGKARSSHAITSPDSPDPD